MHTPLRPLILAFSALILSSLAITGSGPIEAQNRLARAPVYPVSGIVGDFNGDGRADLLSVGAGTLKLAAGTTSGSFAAPTSLLAISGSPVAIASGDFNGDGKQDIVLAMSSTINVYLGNGNGTYQTPKISSYSGGVSRLAVAQINRDTHLDLVAVVNGAQSSVNVLLGNGNGTFQTARKTPLTDELPLDFALGDVNLDGITDITVSDLFQFQELLGNGDGTFRVRNSFLIDSYEGYGHMVITDFNGDGKPDLVVSNLNTFLPYGYCGDVEISSVTVFPGYGDGTFNLSASATYDAGNGGIKMMLADFTGDGKTDLAVLHSLGATVAILPRTSTGIAHAPSGRYAVADTSSDLGVGDVNGDGRKDLLVFSNHGVQVFLNRGAGVFAAPSAIDVGLESLELLTSNFNRDGFSDLVILTPDNSFGCKDDGPAGAAFVSPGSTGGLANFNLRFALQDMDGFSGTPPSSLSLGDFNGDKNVDVALNAAVGFNNGAAQFPNSYPYMDPPAALSASGHTSVNYTTAAGDFNGDGKADLATVGNTTLETRRGNGNGTFQPPVTYSLGGTDANAVLIRDVNGDGKPDIISANYGNSTVSVFLSNGNGTFKPASQFSTTTHPVVLTAGDFNKDGKIDLAVASATKVSILLGNGSGGFSLVRTITGGKSIQGIASVILRGNGVADLVLVDRTANSAILLYGNGDGTFAAPLSFAVGSTPTSVTVGDFNNDGALDVAVALRSASAIPVLYNQGGTRVVLTSSNKVPKVGQSVTFTTTVAASLPGNPAPTGTVVFKNGTATIGTVTLSGGKATLSYSALSKGSHSITAVYSGNTNFNSHTSTAVTESVQ